MKFNFFKSNFCVFFLFILTGGLYSSYISQEIYWDFAHYHYYNAWAFLNGRTFTDLAPAGIHSYFNPLLDLPLYTLLEFFNFYPKIIFFYQGLWAGALWFLVYKLVSLILPSQMPIQRVGIFCACIFSALGFAIVRQIGTSTNEIQLAVLFLTAVYFILKSCFINHKFCPKTMFFSALMLGAACGLKLTIIPMVFALGIVSLFFFKNIPAYKKTFILMFFGGLVGFLLTNGWWMWQLWTHFENPLFPFANNFFKSPYMPLENYRDTNFLPTTLSMWLFYPFYWLLDSKLVTDVFSSNFQYVLTYVCVIVLGLLLLMRKISLSKIQLFVLCFWITAYILWLGLFSILRYGVILEAFNGIFVVLAIQLLVHQRSFQLILYMLVLIYSLMMPFSYGKWVYYKDYSFGVYYAIEPYQIVDDAVVIFYGSPVTIVGTKLKTKARYIGVKQSFEQDPNKNFILFQNEKQKILSDPDTKIVVIGLGNFLNDDIITQPGISCKHIGNTLYLNSYGICPPPDADGVVRGYKASLLKIKL